MPPINTYKYKYKEIGLTEEQHDGPEEREAEEHLSMADKRVVWVFLRVHLSSKCHTGNNIHGEAAETSAEHTQTKTSSREDDNIILIACVHSSVITCGCQRLLLTQRRRSGSSSGHRWLC